MKKEEEKKGTLSGKVFKGTAWLFAFQVIDNIIAFIRLFILARFLGPNDFGLIGVATLVIQIISTFTQPGITAFLIHRKQVDAYMDSGWTFLVLRGVFLYSLIFLCAPLVGFFFNNHTSIMIVRVIGLSLLFEGLTNIGIVLFQKRLEFQKQFILQIIGNMTDFTVTIVSVFILKNMWAFILGYLASSFARALCSYFLSEYRPKVRLNFDEIKEMSHYGKWVASSSILMFLYSQGDDILVGRILGVVWLGYYQLAYRVSNLPATQITTVVSSVMFPAYATVQDNIKKLRDIYLLTLQFISFLSFFLGTIIIMFAHDFIILILGAKWLPIESSLQILTIWGIIRSVGATSGPVWQAIGKPKVITITQIIQVIVMAITILPLTYMWKITGTSIAVVISALIPNIVGTVMISRALQIRVNASLKELLIPVLSSVFMILTYYLLSTYVVHGTNYIAFIIKAVVVSVIYFGFTILMSKSKRYLLYKNVFHHLEESALMSKFPVIDAIKKFVL